MTVYAPTPSAPGAPCLPAGPRRRRLTAFLRLACAGLLGLAAALLVSCGGSGKGLIPTGDAGPLQSDFEAVARAAENGDGSCTETAEAIRKTEHDFAALPLSVDAGLRSTLERGISNLRSRALSLCAQPLAQTTTTDASPLRTTTSTQTATTPPVTETTPTVTTPTVTETPPTPGGGTSAPGVEEQAPGTGNSVGGGTGAGAGENGVGQEPGK